jgi:dynein heavy chain
MSLGQGQEARAAAAIERGSREGKWVLLQNCHLFKSWMPQLEAICSGLIDNQPELDEKFRLILTSMPVDFFPSSIV